MTIDILICSFNKGIVKIEDVLLSPRPEVNYVVSFQYTDERYLELIPRFLTERTDVRIFKYKGQGLSANRNQALSHAHSDVAMYADDDTRLSNESIDKILEIFSSHADLDVALFRATSYTGRLLKQYPEHEMSIETFELGYSISTIEAAFRTESIKGKIRFDERFGLGSKFLTSYDENIWLHDVISQKLRVKFFPISTIQTSTIIQQSLIYVDAGVQRSYGAYLYFVHGWSAWYHCLKFALRYTLRGYCHFLPTLHHLLQGVRYIRQEK